MFTWRERLLTITSTLNTFFFRSCVRNQTTSNSNFKRYFYHSSDFDSTTVPTSNFIETPDYLQEHSINVRLMLVLEVHKGLGTGQIDRLQA